MSAYWKQSAGVRERIIIVGQLKLTSPTNLSNGDSEGLTDIDLRRDPVDNRPVLPGASLAGALRDYAFQHFGRAGKDDVEYLFGRVDDAKSMQSRLFIDDALGQESGVEIRDGVAIDPRTRTAAEHKKFDLELLAAGTIFPLSLELWLPDEDSRRAKTLEIVAVALDGLTRGDIRLGTRKRRGFGGCRVAEWLVYRYDMGDPAAVVRWLEDDRSIPASGATLAERLGLTAIPAASATRAARLSARLAIDGSLLIRSAPTDPEGPDMVHLRNRAGELIVPGTSLAGALRARAGRIAGVLLADNQKAVALVNDLFGPLLDGDQGQPRGGRLWVSESKIEDARADLVQSRVMIDRFTGGSYPGALFDEQPVLAGAFIIDLRVARPTERDAKRLRPKAKGGELDRVRHWIAEREVGLLLLLLKDLWTGELPIGGESSIGRGRLRGEWARLEWDGETWEFEATVDGRLRITGDPERLQEAVDRLKEPSPEAPTGREEVRA